MSGQLGEIFFGVHKRAKVNCGKAAREGALGYDLGTPFVNSSALTEP